MQFDKCLLFLIERGLGLIGLRAIRELWDPCLGTLPCFYGVLTSIVEGAERGAWGGGESGEQNRNNCSHMREKTHKDIQPTT